MALYKTRSVKNLIISNDNEVSDGGNYNNLGTVIVTATVIGITCTWFFYLFCAVLIFLLFVLKFLSVFFTELL